MRTIEVLLVVVALASEICGRCLPQSTTNDDGTCLTAFSDYIDARSAFRTCGYNGRFPLPQDAFDNFYWSGLTSEYTFPRIWLQLFYNGSAFVDQNGNLPVYTNWGPGEPSLKKPGTGVWLQSSDNRWYSKASNSWYFCITDPDDCGYSVAKTEEKKLETKEKGANGKKEEMLAKKTHTSTHVLQKTGYANYSSPCVQAYAGRNPCIEGWSHFPLTCSCYKAYEDTFITRAEQDCRAAAPNGHLTSIHSSEEAIFVTDLVGMLKTNWQLQNNGRDNIIVGLGYNDRTWSWNDGTPFDYSEGFLPISPTSFTNGQLVYSNPPGFRSFLAAYDCQSKSCRAAVCKYPLA